MPENRTYTVGVISDTHGLLRIEALAALQGSNYIIHAGDVGDPQILRELEQIAPVAAVRGNVDGGKLEELPDSVILEVGHISIYVLHDLNQLDLSPVAAGFQVVISGHSHQPAIAWQNKVLYFNPGSAGPRRFKLPITLGRRRVSGKLIEPEIVALLNG